MNGNSRRDFLKVMAATSLCAMAPASEFLAQSSQYEPIESTVNEIPGLKIPRDVLEMMERKNAERLLPRFKV